LKETAFSLTRTDPFPKSPIEIGGIFYIIRFKEGVQARKEAFDSQEEALLRVEEEKKRNESYRAWLAALRTMVEIKISSAEL